MSDLAKIRLQQARVHMQAGSTAKAVELLEQARALARSDRATLVSILQELVQTYNGLGRRQQADECAAELAALTPAPSAAGSQFQAVHKMPRRRVVPILLVTTTCLLIGAVGVIVWLMAGLRYDERPASTAASPAQPVAGAAAAAGTPTAGPPAQQGVTFVPVPPPAAVPASAPAIPATQAFAAPQPSFFPPSAGTSNATPAERERATLIKEGVGLVIQVARYQGPVDGHVIQAELPVSTGTCFAVGRSGLMLTNRHVVSLPPEGLPATLEELSMPTVMLQGVATIVCFGSEPASHHQANVLHLSSQFDTALLKVDRTFRRPFSLGSGPATMGEQIFVCGYPDAVSVMLTQANEREVAGKFLRQASTGTLSYTIWFDKGAFEPTLTAGIVSAARRQLGNASYIQIDAKVSSGNSGGPLLNRKNEVIGMVALGGSIPEAQGYNFALSLAQIMDEIKPYLKAS